MKTKKQLGVVNGQDEQKTKKKPTTLDEVFGYDSFSEYKTSDETEYEDSLREMNLADLYDHCPRKGVLPAESRERTVKRLLEAFRNHKAKYSGQSVPPNKMSKKKQDLALKILRS